MLRKTISVVISVAIAAVANDEGDKLDVKFEAFHDRNDVTALSPIFLLSKSVAKHVTVDWEGQWDVVTGASREMGTSGGQGDSPMDGVTGASGNWENRFGSRVGATYANQGRVFSGSVYASRENDYQSFSPALGGS